MAQLAVIKKASEGVRPLSQYNQDKWSLGDLIKKRTDIGSIPFIGPMVTSVARPVEQSAAIPGVYPHVVRWANKAAIYSTGTVAVSGTAVTGNGTAWLSGGIALTTLIGFGSTDPDQITTWYNIDSITSDTALVLSTSAGTIGAGSSYVIKNILQIDWVFLCDNATAAITRRIQLYEYNRENSTWGWRGFITITPTATATHTARSLRMDYQKYDVGTVAVTNGSVTGTNTLWQTNRMVGAGTTMAGRIGFGSTDPTQIKTWYYVNTITGEGAMTISMNASTNVAPTLSIGAGTPYVLEDLRAYMLTTNTTNGGLFVAKGLSYADFTSGGTTIPIAAGTDNLKQTYWLKDASTLTNTGGAGIAMEPMTDWVTRNVYVLDTATIKIFKYNVRSALTLTGAAATNAFILATGNQAVTGTLSQVNNGRYGVLNHGPASGTPAIYFVTTTRIYCVPTANITSGSTTFLTYTMTEVPPGGVSTFAATGALSSVEIADTIDRLVVTSTGSAGVRSYVTQYNTSGSAMDHIFLIDSKQLDQSSADSSVAIHPSISALAHTPWAEAGLLYLASVGTTAAANFLHAQPIGVDWTYASVAPIQRAISPRMSTPNAIKFVSCFSIRDKMIGGDLLGKSTDPMRMYYRTTGISDNSGGWNSVAEGNDLSAVAGANEIQFMMEFRGITDYCIGARIFSIGVIYEDGSTDSHYRFSGTLSSAASKRFAFRFATAFGSTVPRLRLRLYNDVTNALLRDDDSTTQAVTWEKSTNDGGAWGSYDTTDKGNDTTYIRITDAALGDNIKVRAVLTLY